MTILTQKMRVSNEASHRRRDENGFIHVDWSPILRAGILEYLGSELLTEGSDEVDGVKIDPDKIYKVYLSEEEIEKAKDTFCGLPLLDGHQWVGVDGADPKGRQQGSVGTETIMKEGLLYAPLSFTGQEAISDLEEREKEELSSSYTNRLTAAEPGAGYDFIATEIKGNHVALVERGRCGPDVRVLNSKEEIKMAARKLRVGNKKFKVVNEAKLILDGKEVDLDQFFEEEREERDDGKDIHEESIEEVSNEDKREIIREIMAVSAKADSDFEGGEDEKVREIAKLAEKLAYNPSERSETDNKRGPCSTNEDIDEEADDKARSENSARLMNAAIENLKRKQDQEIKAARRAYNSVSAAIGRDFNPFGMSETEILAYGLKELGYEGLNGKETAGELRVAMNAMSQVRRVDNSFEPSLASAAEDEVSINI